MQRYYLRSLAALGLACAVVASIGLAAPVPKNNPAVKELKIEQLRKVLDSVVTLEYNQIALPNVLTQLGDEHKIPLILDRNALTQLGFDENTLLIDSKQKDVKLRTGLRNILNTYGLTLAIVGDQVVVSTEELALYKQFKQRIDVNFNDVPVSKVMRELSQQHGVNIVLDPKCVKAKTTETAVTLQLEDVALEAVVRLVTEMAGLKAARLSNVIYITTEDRADKINKDSELLPNPNPSYPGGTLPNGAPNAPGLGGIVPIAPAAVPVNPPPAP